MKNRLARLVCVSLILHFSFFTFHSTQAQIAGMNTLTVLDLSSQARTSALGFDYLSIYDIDPTVGIDNPSLLRREMCGIGSLSFVSVFDGTSMGTLSYAHYFEHVGTLLFSFRYNNYGTFDGYDEEEMPIGKVSAADYSFTVGWGMWLDSNFSVGVNFKPVLSQYDVYTAFAMAFDVAGSYVSDNRRLAATVMARNIGAQVSTFDGMSESLPFELSAELSYKLANAPFRFFFATTELQRWDLRYEDPNNPTTTLDPFTGEVKKEGWFEGFFDNLMRHTQFGVELNLGRAFFARVGYSYRQTAEMSAIDAINFSGLSFGFGLRTKKLEFSYAHRNYHLGQAPDFFTLSYRF